MGKGSAVTENGRIVIVGASLAGLRAAEALRKEGFLGRLTIIGEPNRSSDVHERLSFPTNLRLGRAANA